MAVIVMTSKAKTLVDSIKGEINDGKIQTWVVDDEGDFQHDTSSQQWKRAWIHPQSYGKCSIEFTPLFPSKYEASALDLGVIQGRFSEMLIGHFSKYIDNIVITPAK